MECKDIVEQEINNNKQVLLKKLDTLKKLRNLSYKQLADSIGISKSQAYFIWQGVYEPNEKVKQQIADFFQVNALELWKENEDKQ